MRRVMILLFAAVLSFAQQPPVSITDPATVQSVTRPAAAPLSLDRLYTSRAIGGSTWSPDGAQVAFTTNISGRMNLWLVPSEGGWPNQLTVSGNRQIQPSWSPDGRMLAISSTRQGGSAIWILQLNGTGIRRLTRGGGQELPDWSPHLSGR